MKASGRGSWSASEFWVMIYFVGGEWIAPVKLRGKGVVGSGKGLPYRPLVLVVLYGIGSPQH